LRAIDSLSFWPKKVPSASDPNIQKAIVNEEDDNEGTKNGNILIERKYLSFYTNVFKTEMLLYAVLGNAVFYMGIAFTIKNFNRQFMLGMLIPGMAANLLCIYARTVKYKEYEMQASPIYKKELQKY
jgi:hypothetical protein